ncbi:MAG: hypothetical protein QW231_07010 [Candidatus Bathyarchaeia archaeon]
MAGNDLISARKIKEINGKSVKIKEEGISASFAENDVFGGGK